MLTEFIIKTIISPRKAFKEEIPTIFLISYTLLSGNILFLYTAAFVKYGIKNILNNIPFNLNNDFILFENFASSPKLYYLTILFPFITLFLSTAVYDTLAQIVFKKGNAAKLIKNFAFASIPLTISRLLYTIFTLLKINYPQEINFLFFIWEIVLFIFAISETYEIELGKASLIFFMPYLMILIFAIPVII